MSWTPLKMSQVPPEDELDLPLKMSWTPLLFHLKMSQVPVVHFVNLAAEVREFASRF